MPRKSRAKAAETFDPAVYVEVLRTAERRYIWNSVSNVVDVHPAGSQILRDIIFPDSACYSDPSLLLRTCLRYELIRQNRLAGLYA